MIKYCLGQNGVGKIVSAKIMSAINVSTKFVPAKLGWPKLCWPKLAKVGQKVVLAKFGHRMCQPYIVSFIQ
jgi:hypothetical protein